MTEKRNKSMSEKKQYIRPELSVEELTKALYEANKELDAVNRELACANETLEKNEKSRSEMFANISHDLRSPIAAIRSAVEYILSDKDIKKDERDKILRLILSKTKNLENLIENIFLMARLDNNVVKPSRQPVPADFFFEDYFYMTREDSKYKDRKLEFDEPDFQATLNIDVNQIERVLDNLFNNALKYSKKGDEIRLSVERENKYVKVCVSDTGIGIAEDKTEKIFDSSYMIKESRTPEKENSFGLGLSIARSFVELNGGKIWCESREGCGSRFYFTLPVFEEGGTNI